MITYFFISIYSKIIKRVFVNIFHLLVQTIYTRPSCGVPTAALTCDRLAKALTFFERTEQGMFIYYTIILLLLCAFNCDFVSNLAAIDGRHEIVRDKIVRLMRIKLLAHRALSSRKKNVQGFARRLRVSAPTVLQIAKQ